MSAPVTGALVIQNVASWEAGSGQPTVGAAGSGTRTQEPEDGVEETWKEGLPGHFQDSAYAG